MGIFYWAVGYIIISLLWIIPTAIITALLINGVLVSLSMTVWEMRIYFANNISRPSIWQLVKCVFIRIITQSLTDSSITIRSKYGTWNYLFKHVVWKVTEEKS